MTMNQAADCCTETATGTPAPRFDASTVGLMWGCFFVSGMAALVYQVVWLRMLVLIFGHTVYATTIMLAVFMAGLGLGARFFGIRAARFRSPFRTYGVLEVAIAGLCALTPGLAGLAQSLYVSIQQTLGLSQTPHGILVLLLAAPILLLPTMAMGGTLPILTEALVRAGDGAARTVGVLYALNTFGAVLGAVSTGFLLLPALGNRTTLVLAVLANTVVGVAAIAYGGGAGAFGTATSRNADGASASSDLAQDHHSGNDARAARLVIAALGVSGAVSMLYEVAWTRALALIIGSSTYAFTSMLAGFLVGIAVGAALYSWGAGTRPRSLIAFATIQGGVALTVAGTLLLFERMPDLVLLALRHSHSPSFVVLVQFVLCAGILVPSTVLIGATFPCAAGICIRTPAYAGRDVGTMYLWNTVGSIGGAVLAGFILIPAIGVFNTLKVGVLVNVALAVSLLIADNSPARAMRWGAIGAVPLLAAGVVLIPPWSHAVLSRAPIVYARHYLQEPNKRLSDAVRDREVLFYRDGLGSTVSVTRAGEFLVLRTNGKAESSTAPQAMPTQLMLGHLPLLLHPEPRTVLMIGLGGGISAGAVARHPVEKLDVIEIEPVVIEAARFFTGESGDVLNDPRVRTVIGDARNFLLGTTQSYDVIISQPSHLWVGGVASLFSREFFQLARQHLKPAGFMLQWVQAASMFPVDLKTIVRTFRSAFPATSIWRTGPADFLLLGRVHAVPVDMNLLKARYQGNAALRHDLERIGIFGWSGVLGYFMLGEEEADRYAGDAPIDTDDRLRLEFSAPRALYLDNGVENLELARRFKGGDLPEISAASRAELEQPEVRLWIGATFLAQGAKEEALRYLPRSTVSSSSDDETSPR